MNSLKEFSYTWTTEYYLLHLQLDSSGNGFYSAQIKRSFVGGTSRSEILDVVEGEKSFRVLISRTHPKETSFLIKYPQEVILKVYQLDDRAFFPTTAFFIS